MQVTVKQGHNLAQLCKGTINAGLICAVTLNGTTVSTMPQKGADPEWEDKAFSFQVSERPFPLTCAVALVHGKQAEKVAEGQVLLTAGTLSASRKATLWVPLAQAQDKQVQSPAHANAHRSLHGNHPQYLDASSNFESSGSEDSFEQSGPGVYIEVRHDDHGHEQEEEMSSCGKPSAQARAPSEQPVAEHEGDVLQGNTLPALHVCIADCVCVRVLLPLPCMSALPPVPAHLANSYQEPGGTVKGSPASHDSPRRC